MSVSPDLGASSVAGLVDRRLTGSQTQIILMEHPETDFSWVSHHSGPTSSSRAVSVIGASAVLFTRRDLGFSPR